MEIPWWVAALAGIVLALLPSIFLVGKLRPRAVPDKQVAEIARLSNALSRGSGALSYKQIHLIEKAEPSMVMRVIQSDFFEWSRERQGAVVNLLARLGYVDLALDQISSQNHQKRAQAVEMLGILQSPNGVMPLIDLLSDPEEEVRWAASAALCRIQEPSVIEPLLKALEEPTEVTPARVADVLISMGSHAVKPLLDAYPHMEEKARGICLEILGQIGDNRAVESLINGIRDESPWVRSKAVQALGEMRVIEAGPQLVEVLQDPVPEVRARAAQALGCLEWWGALSALNEARKDRDWLVRVSANQALAALTGKKNQNSPGRET
jgi:HEAT repeat protein